MKWVVFIGVDPQNSPSRELILIPVAGYVRELSFIHKDMSFEYKDSLVYRLIQRMHSDESLKAIC